MQETLVQFLGREGLLEKGKGTPSSILAWVAESDNAERLSLYVPFPVLYPKVEFYVNKSTVKCV